MEGRALGLVILVSLLALTTAAGSQSKTELTQAEKTGRTKAEIEAKIDEFVEAMLACYNIPGLNLAVVKDRQPYLSKGYGVRDLQTGEPFTNQTLVVIASVTKAFVATVVGLTLDESEEATWDTPVRDVLGDWFYFHDSHRTTMATIKDLLSHRMGLPRHDQMRIYGYTTRELMERLRFLEFSQQWRESPMYNNLMYGLASYVAETLAGGDLTWEDMARERLFSPLGMAATSFVHQDEERWPQYATGYITDDDDELRKVSLEVTKAYYNTISAPGAVVSNAEDMAKWLLMHLNDGVNSEGEQVVPVAILQDTHRPASVMDEDPVYSRPDDPVTYSSEKRGLGWREAYYRGYRKSSHTGSRDGYKTKLSLLPDVGIGVYLTINNDDDTVRELIHMFVMDLLLGVDPWLDIEAACDIGKKGLQVSETGEHTGVQPDPCVHRVQRERIDEDYVGVYGHYAYGNTTVFINETSGMLSVHYGAAEWELTETNDDTFNAQGIDPFWYWTMTVNFYRDGNEVNEVRLPFQSGSHPTFVRGLDMSTAPPPPEICP